MSNIVIKVEDIGKQYKLGEIGTGTISHDLNRWFAKMRGKEDPFAKVGDVNDRTKAGNSDYVWALRDVNFEVNKGDVLGIIGRNGAGKSTLLKILSKVTTPTTGNIKIKGRIASLLEVGTGFHPELTGRENVFLNGAILGMTKSEIRKKFDEIVDFAGVQRYIDTPVKRYSSGMYVRLAFAVAAFLEPEILIIDEVLAVGDAEFQKKCLGRMKDVSVNEGRTVLFVSHHLPSVKQLCNKGLLMNNGTGIFFNRVEDALERYQFDSSNATAQREINPNDKQGCYIMKWYLTDVNHNEIFSCYTRQTVNFKVEILVTRPLAKAELGFIIRNNIGDIIYSCNSRDFKGSFVEFEPGTYTLNLKVRLPLKGDSYVLDLAVASEGHIVDHWVSPIPLRVLADYEGVLDERWLGILNEEFLFDYDKVG